MERVRQKAAVFHPELVQRKHPSIGAENAGRGAPFSREAWNGRRRACRGVGASLPPEQVEAFSHTHLKMLRETMPENFSVLYEISILKLQFL